MAMLARWRAALADRPGLLIVKRRVTSPEEGRVDGSLCAERWSLRGASHMLSYVKKMPKQKNGTCYPM